MEEYNIEITLSGYKSQNADKIIALIREGAWNPIVCSQRESSCEKEEKKKEIKISGIRGLSGCSIKDYFGYLKYELFRLNGKVCHITIRASKIIIEPLIILTNKD